MAAIAAISAALALAALAVFVLLVISIRGTDRRLSLRQPPSSRIDTFTRRVLGAYSNQANSAHSETTQYQAKR